MTTALTHPALRDVLSLYAGDAVAGLSDADLLRRFVDALDHSEPDAADAAFSALMSRHGPMVLGVCRRALDDPNDVDDVFQATFLVLVRRARAVRVEGSLGRWLYGVSRKVAARARSEASRRRAQLAGNGDVPSREDNASDSSEVHAAIDEEIARLPERYRAPIVLCGLDGLSYEEAAGRLRWPVGTLKSRLSRGKDRLAERLTRRGFSPAAAMARLGRLSFPVPAPLAAAALGSARRLATDGVVAASLRRLVLTRLAIPTGPIAKAVTVATLALGLVGTALLDVRADGPTPTLPGSADADKPGGLAVAAAITSLDDLNPAPGCVWENKPEALGVGAFGGLGVGKGTLAYYTHAEAGTGALIVVLTQARTDETAELRPVAFDATGRRFVVGPGDGGIGMGGVVRFQMQHYRLDPKALPADKATYLGIERLTPEFHQLAGLKARDEAKAAALSILPPPRVGEPFDFDLATGDGHRVRSADLRGKVVLVDGWATWCSPCMDKMPKLKAFRDAHRGDGFEVVGVCFSDPSSSRITARTLGIDWPQIYVPSDEKAHRLWVEGAEALSLPHILLIDRAGKLRKALTPDEIEKEVEALLREPAPASR